ncbi:MAG: Dot/Icm T4SS effector Wip [Gammaproteobacteria bacterium]
MAISHSRITNTVISQKQADIDKFPIADSNHPAHEDNELTIGDLHGNALKLVYFLVRQNVISMDPGDYAELVRIYKMSPNDLTQNDLFKFGRIVALMKANPVGTVRLIGDEFCDRGSNDYFTLKILQRLHELSVPYEILASNHGMELIFQAESNEVFKPRILQPLHASSMLAMQKLIDRGLIKRKTIIDIINKDIKPALKPLSYTLAKGKISIFTHAGIGLDQIISLAKKIGVKYNDDSPEDLAHTIDDINTRYAGYLQKNKVNKLYLHKILVAGYANQASPDSKEIDSEKYPFEYAIWNRFYTHLKRPLRHVKGYRLDFIHGHDDKDIMAENIFDLDNALGKAQPLHIALYHVLYSQEIPGRKLHLVKRFDVLESQEESKTLPPVPQRLRLFVPKNKPTMDKSIIDEDKLNKIKEEVINRLNDEKLIRYVSVSKLSHWIEKQGEHAPNLLKDLLFSMKRCRVSPDNLQRIIEQTDNFLQSYDLLSTLADQGLMAPEMANENFNFALTHSARSRKIELAFLNLAKEEKLAIQANFRTLANLGTRLSYDSLLDVSNIMMTLSRENMLNDVTRSALESAMYFKELNKALPELIRRKLVDQDIFVLLTLPSSIFAQKAEWQRKELLESRASSATSRARAACLR